MAKQSKKEIREDRFCREYIIDLNGTRAAIAAGYSKKTAKATASRMLTKSNLLEKISKLQKAVADKLDLTAHRVLGELCKLGFSNFLDYVRITADGSFAVDLSKLTREQAAAIWSIKTTERVEGKGEDVTVVTKTEFKLADKIRALELLGKHLKLFTEVIEVPGLDGLADRIAAARKRANEQG